MGRWMLTVAVLLVLLGGCGGNDNNDNQGQSSPTPTVSPTPSGACTSVEFTFSEESPINLGFTGFVHDWLMPRGGKVTFPLSDCDCITDNLCTLGSPTGPKRCTISYAACETDSDCGGEGGQCLVAAIGGPPVPLAGAGVPSCLTLFFADESTGTVNLADGTLATAWKLLARAHATQLPNIPCPVCVRSSCSDDPLQSCNTDADCDGGQCQLPQLGAQGTCTGGLNDGKACAVDGLSALFGGLSTDCPPDPNTNVSGSGIRFDFLPLTTGTTTLSANLTCTGAQGVSCPCGVCSDDAQRGCRSDGDCEAGTCQPAEVLPNACESLGCASNNSCATGPQQGMCMGQQFTPCSDDSGCMMGSCDDIGGIPCFSFPVVEHGESQPFGGDSAKLDLVSSFCIPASATPSFNQVTGLPGPGFAELGVSLKVNR